MAKTIILDTSVMISALIGKRGAAREIVRKCLLNEFNPLISNALFLEYEDVSRRERILDACPLTSNEINELLHAFYRVCEWVPIYYLWRPNVPDENDNFLIELALAGNADYIVTNNTKDLSSAELSFPELQIVTPAQLLRGK